jgi:hypothetical protein
MRHTVNQETFKMTASVALMMPARREGHQDALWIVAEYAPWPTIFTESNGSEFSEAAARDPKIRALGRITDDPERETIGGAYRYGILTLFRTWFSRLLSFVGAPSL